MHGTPAPLVSVILPTFGRPNDLRLALASAVGQSYGQNSANGGAAVILAALLRCGERGKAWRQLRTFWREGLVRPILLQYPVYALRLRRATASARRGTNHSDDCSRLTLPAR